jgi:glycosyltransferase involved in cell wall biosynthesis
MRVLHVLGTMVRGGIETWLLRVIPLLPERHRIDLLVHSPERGEIEPELERAGARILRGPDPRRPWRYTADLADLMRTHGPWDAAQAQVYLYSGVVLRAAQRCGVGVRIAHLHPLGDIGTDGVLRRCYRAWMGSLIARHATCCMYPSHASAQAAAAWLGRGAPAPVLMPNGIPLDELTRPRPRDAVRQALGIPAEAQVVAYVGRFVPHKDHRLLFAVARHLRAAGRPVHLVLAGSGGPTLGEIRDLARSEGHATVLPDHPDLPGLLAASDVFAFPSREEGFGVVAIEAQAAGVPVVASDLPSIQEALAPELRTLCFPLGDARTAADRIAGVLADPLLHQRLTTAGRVFAQKFSIPAAAQALCAAYDALEGGR